MTGSFERFLTRYCQELTGLSTTSLKLFFEAVRTDAPRAAEPLLLALLQGREGFLLRRASGTPYEERFRAFLARHEESALPLEPYLRSLPEGDRCRKAWAAWQSERTRLERDRKTLANVRDRMDELLRAKNLSRAEACRLLGLNKGNFYAFMKGDVSKLSRETAVASYRMLAEG